jgi:hypothetical protein
MLISETAHLGGLRDYVREAFDVARHEVDIITMGTVYSIGLPGPVPCRRTQEQQRGLWAKGREQRGDLWVIVGPVVTYCDGVARRSDHQDGRAIDCGLRNRQTGEFLWYDGEDDEPREVFMLLVEEMRMAGFKWAPDHGMAWDPHHFWMEARRGSSEG